MRADPDVAAAIAEQETRNGRLRIEVSRGTLAIHPETWRLTVHEAIQPDTPKWQQLTAYLEADEASTNDIVDVLMAHLPGASGSLRDDVRLALDRWRAENVFGVQE